MKKVLFFTGTRADYGLLSPLIQKFESDKNYQTEILATGSHYSNTETYREIEDEGHAIQWPVHLDIKSDGVEDTLHSMSLGLELFSAALKKAKPDLAFVLGDRYEALVFAIVCQFLKIPIAHIHGGELTEGALDDAFRHSITKMSYFHFAANETYCNRIIQLGENPERVFNVGALGVENARNLELKSKETLEKELNIKLQKKILLITFHPATMEKKSGLEQVSELLTALAELIQANSDVQCIFTMPNADPESSQVSAAIEKFQKQSHGHCLVFTSLGRVNYLSLLSLATAVVGNSSSGIIEAPVFFVPSVNIGSRQTGRDKPESVLDCECNATEISKALAKAIALKEKDAFRNQKNLFGDAKTSEKIKAVVDALRAPKDLQKRFYDKTT